MTSTAAGTSKRLLPACLSPTCMYVAGLLVFGSLNTLTTKIQFEMKSIGLDGEEKHFKKPWFGTLTMFLGMIIVLFIHLAKVYANRPRHIPGVSTSKGGESAVAAAQQPLLQTEASRASLGGRTSTSSSPSFWKASLLIGLPAVLDLVATCLCFVGLLYNSASVWQMLRGSMIIFSAILSVIFLKRRLYAYHWVGVVTCCVAIITVGYANIMGSSAGSSPSNVPSFLVGLGMFLIVLGQVIQASQVVAEELLLRGYTIAPFHIVGMEGVWGTLLMVAVVMPLVYLLPGADEGSFENSADTVVMLENSSALRSMVALYIFSVFTYNMSGMMVTYALSAVHRTMIEASRTAVIWIVDLVIHYYIAPSSTFGEAWTSWSWLQLFGFVLLILGQSIYSDVVRVPGLYYPPAKTEANIVITPVAADAGAVAHSPHEENGTALAMVACGSSRSPTAMIYNIDLPDAPADEENDLKPVGGVEARGMPQNGAAVRTASVPGAVTGKALADGLPTAPATPYAIMHAQPPPPQGLAV